ncbi:MAG: putative L-lysine-epsilon aminotransferase [Fimbriimonadaceae bacterium]|nr:putative L-lysine-epsilon aminotransferase [Fimbriimonadaceae bacterium]
MNATPSIAPARTPYPGPISSRMLKEMEGYVVAKNQPFVVDLARSQGMYLATVDGQRLFDWAGYYGSKLIGHNHPGLYEGDYPCRLLTAANNKTANPDFLTPQCLAYYRLLHEIGPECMRNRNLEVYTVNSGAEAVENMMKYLVARFNGRRLAEGKPITNRRFLYFDKAFHGRTVFALGVTQTIDTVATKDFHGLTVGGNIKLPFPSFDSDAPHADNLRSALRALEQVESALALMSDEIVGIIVEPIQGAGGHRVALPEFFRGLSELAHRYGVDLGFDEVQTGGGSTGKMWAADQFDLPHPPAAIASGKKLGNGVLYMVSPLDDIGVLDSTWGGSLVDMVRVVREMEIVFEEKLIEHAVTKGERLAAGLKRVIAKHLIAGNVRGMGIYQGFSLDSPARKAELIRIAREEFDTLLLGAGNRSIRTRPNLSVTEAEIDRFLEIIDLSLARAA